ncbi:unnamed protein product [Microthlaspi erraticum]|uniref:Uncharacterized protein n=1 Tax=Microthlaspi erraticum TaxID=1685480 RepID=A0A6D2IV71_9BRAS|nr:unnamed protein product [Microthlaspi erraticum]
MVKSAPGRSFLGHVKFGSFLFVSSCIKVLVKLKEEFSNRLARLCRDLVCRPYCLRAIGQNELRRLSHDRDDFSVLSFGFADQNVILWSPVKFGGLRSRRLGVGRVGLLVRVMAERNVRIEFLQIHSGQLRFSSTELFFTLAPVSHRQSWS